MPSASYLVVWRYEVKSDAEPAFRVAYGPGGDWDRLFRSSPAFEGTTLVAVDVSKQYLTIDAWRSREEYEAFLAENRDAYDLLDATFEAWTIAEERIGNGAIQR